MPTQMFDNTRFEENQKRITATRKILKVPSQVTQFLTELLTFAGKRSDYFKTCITCEHWSKERQICTKFQILPPAEVIADGCKEYVDYDGIPF